MMKPIMEKLLLSEDIIVEILLLLPLKSLLRFKCVSKRWRFVISCKPFVKRRLKNSSTDPDLSHHYLIGNPHSHRHTVRLCPLRSLFDAPSPSGYQHLRSIYDELSAFGSCNYLLSLIPGSGYDQSYHIEIWASCNGLILVTVAKANLLIIWNPAIRKANPILPPPNQVLQHPRKENRDYYYLGYDESADHYKVVCISITYTRTNTSAQTHVYSSGTCSWKKIESSHDTILRFCGYFGKFVNGRLHWLAFEDNNNRTWGNRKVIVRDIVCLDLVGDEEKYEIMGGPLEYLSIRDGSEPVLKDLGGYLSLVCLTSTFEVNVWIMMKYGDPRSWTKNFTLADQDPGMFNPCAMPLWLKKNGDMAMYFGPNVVVIYNGKHKLHTSPVDIWLHTAIDTVIHVESLVSPFGDEQQS